MRLATVREQYQSKPRRRSLDGVSHGHGLRMKRLRERMEKGVICTFCDEPIADIDVRVRGAAGICNNCKAYPIREVFNAGNGASPPTNLIERYGLRKEKGTWFATR